MEAGSQELARSASTYLACLAFALTYLLTTLCGGSAGTSLLRAVLATAAAWITAGFLLRPALASILDAMARDRAAPRPKDEVR